MVDGRFRWDTAEDRKDDRGAMMARRSPRPQTAAPTPWCRVVRATFRGRVRVPPRSLPSCRGRRLAPGRLEVLLAARPPMTRSRFLPCTDRNSARTGRDAGPVMRVLGQASEGPARLVRYCASVPARSGTSESRSLAERRPAPGEPACQPPRETSPCDARSNREAPRRSVRLCGQRAVAPTGPICPLDPTGLRVPDPTCRATAPATRADTGASAPAAPLPEGPGHIGRTDEPRILEA